MNTAELESLIAQVDEVALIPMVALVVVVALMWWTEPSEEDTREAMARGDRQ
jgi:hypothetical protein